MTTYVVSYDLIKVKDYARITAAIEAYGNWCKPLESLYIIETTQTCTQVRDRLQGFIDSDDRLLVIQCDLNNWASLNLSSEVNQWMGG